MEIDNKKVCSPNLFNWVDRVVHPIVGDFGTSKVESLLVLTRKTCIFTSAPPFIPYMYPMIQHLVVSLLELTCK